MVEFTQATPFVGVVNNARQKKLPHGTEVEVRIIKDGQYGPYALSFVEGREKPVFLNPDHLDYVSDVSAERQSELDAEKAAWAAEKNAPVVIGPGVPHPGGKCVVVEVYVYMDSTNQSSIRKAYFPLSQVTEVDGDHHEVCMAPPWLARIKAVDAAYYWVSQGGRKGIDHFGGAGIAAHYIGDGNEYTPYNISVSDLRDAADRAAEGR